MNRTMTSRSGWTALLWGLAGAVIETVLHALPGLAVPDAARPFVPIVSAALGFLLRHVRTKAVPLAGAPYPIDRE